MNRPISRRDAMRAALSLAGALTLQPARSCEAFATTLRVFHPWSRATRAGATTTAVCMIIDEVTEDDRLIGATTPVASGAQLAGGGVGPQMDLFLLRGSETVLSEDDIHIQLVGLQQQLLLGRQFPLMLHFEKGGTVYTQLSIDQLPRRETSGG